ncbi:hypothetical protein AGLY_010929 [Aphis glycines]|uniref:Uncharacterized protein n=1 Tax=Aphis glycines TaxID=307491 RepID=A0A6G0TE79_APHGL|nr:hypothetical protein AGLY_010929 [Aphis glycines]
MSASEMLCFSRHLGVMIGYAILLTTLIKEHHQLYLQLFNTNLKPKHHHLLHYPYVMKKVGPVSHLWSMRFESKHRESKLTAHSITSRKNICCTLSIKHQLKLAYCLLSKSIIDFNVVSFVSWVEVKGTRYSTKHNMTIIVDVEDMPKFMTIKYIFFMPQSEIPFLIGQVLNTQQFNENLQAYEVKTSTNLICISFNSLLVEHSPCTLNTLSNRYISLSSVGNPFLAMSLTPLSLLFLQLQLTQNVCPLTHFLVLEKAKSRMERDLVNMGGVEALEFNF